mgnify:FL=1
MTRRMFSNIGSCDIGRVKPLRHGDLPLLSTGRMSLSVADILSERVLYQLQMAYDDVVSAGTLDKRRDIFLDSTRFARWVKDSRVRI